jgi:hypothetical protein
MTGVVFTTFELKLRFVNFYFHQRFEQLTDRTSLETIDRKK